MGVENREPKGLEERVAATAARYSERERVEGFDVVVDEEYYEGLGQPE